MKPFSRDSGMSFLLAALVPLALLSSSSPAQQGWASIAYSPAHPVEMESSIIVHDDGTQVRAFSAATQTWTALAPTGAAVLGGGVGGWVAALKTPTTIVFYSARRNATTSIPISAPLAYVALGDDLVVVVLGPSGSTYTAVAYSAETNTTAAVTFTSSPASLIADVAVSRFVAVVRNGNAYHGFAARTGTWATLVTTVPGASPQANGNTGLADLHAGGAGPLQYAAFSGVLGSWALSPAYASNTAAFFDHNVAYVKASAGTGVFHSCGWSAYDGRWVTSTVTHNLGDTTTLVSDNVIRVEDIGSPRFEAFGARPGTSWAAITGTLQDVFPIGNDYAMVRDTTAHTVLAFSGLCGRGWVSTPYGASFSLTAGPSHVGVFADGIGVHAFSPATATWTTLAAPPNRTLIAGDAVVDVSATLAPTGSLALAGYATRWSHWTAGPTLAPGTFTTDGIGSLILRERTSGAGAPGTLTYFDERCDRWSSFSPGVVTSITLGRSVALVRHVGAPETVWGYSVARGDWTTPPGAATGPALIPPQVEENVGYYVDAAGRLQAFGGDGDLHAWFDWPNGTEYQTFGIASAAVPPTALKLSVRGNPGEAAAWLLAGAPQCPGLAIPGIGNRLELDPGSLVLVPAGTVPASSLLVGQAVPPSPATPYCATVFAQAVLGGTTVRFGAGFEGGWIF